MSCRCSRIRPFSVFGPSIGRRQPERAVDLAHRRRAFGERPCRSRPRRAPRRRGQRGGELADDLLEDVLQRHQAHQLAVLVHHQRDALLVLLEVLQLREAPAWRCGHEIGLDAAATRSAALVERPGAQRRRAPCAGAASRRRRPARRGTPAGAGGSWWRAGARCVSDRRPRARSTRSARGTMMSCTVIALEVEQVDQDRECFFGMKFEYSSTSVRISSARASARRRPRSRMRSSRSSGFRMASVDAESRCTNGAEITRQPSHRPGDEPRDALGVVLPSRLGTSSPTTIER